MKTKNLIEQMKGMKEAYILEAINKLRTENPEMHGGIIDYFFNQYDEYSQSSEEYVAEGLKGLSKEMELEWADHWKIWIESLRQKLIQSKHLTLEKDFVNQKANHQLTCDRSINYRP